ncbi:MAG: cytochrome c biogenesis protein CcsA, partial [Halobacteriales archaeon]|nr:cytochrome c biogenesis protein CcsA [Halobacteriales archaeon]
MALGPALLLGALACTGMALASAVLHARWPSRGADRRAAWLTLLATGFTALAWLDLLAAFLRHDYGIYAVWAYSDDATPPYLRVAGTWAGSAGSIFLWTLVIGLALCIEQAWRIRARRGGSDAADAPSNDAARAVGLGFLACFLLLTLAAQPFAPSSQFHLDGSTGFFAHVPCPDGSQGCPTPTDYRAQGFGLNPLLETPFMAIHPPFEFLAYGFTALVGAFGIAAIATRDARWHLGALAWARAAWLCYAIALGLGALWAYYVLSFGGYWAWDPVEVGDLIPFLGLTALLHALDQHRKQRAWPLYAPWLAGICFALTLFGTFVTRSSFWISAHAFDVGASGIVVDPATRLVATLATKPQVALVVGLLLALLAGFAALFLARFVRDVAWTRARKLTWPALALLGAFLLLMLLAAFDVRGFVTSGLGLAGALGQGNALLGVAALGLLLLGAPLALHIVTLPDEVEPQDLSVARALEPDTLMTLGVVLLSLGLLVTLALLVVGVNFTVGQLAQVFQDREPLIALPLVLVLTLRLSVKHFDPRRSAAVALGALGLGLLLWLALPAPLKLLGLGVPPLSLALGAALHQVLQTARKSSAAPRDAQRAGMLLLLAGFAGVAMWASPPTSLALGPLTLAVPLAAVPLGLAASLACIVLGVPVVQGESRRIAWLGGACALLAVGYGISIVLGLAALGLARAAPATGQPLLAVLRHHKGRFHGVGRWSAHAAILLVFIGFGASAYHASQLDLHDLTDPLQRGVPRDLAGYRLTLVDSTGEDLDHDGTFERVTALVSVERDGHVLDLAPIAFY